MLRCIDLPIQASYFLKSARCMPTSSSFAPRSRPHRYCLLDRLFTKAVPSAMNEQQTLPPLSAQDFKVYNRGAEKMDYFHGFLRRSWNLLWDATTSGRRPASMTMKQFITEGLRFAEHLEIHHGIEETHIFPYLAKKMPEFRTGRDRQAAELLRQHQEIHNGLEGFRDYLERCLHGEEELRLDVLRRKMDGWREVLWTHLDQEVKTLGAENMRRYWTKEEMARIPM
ncbi:hypothetical protein BDV33DRAFT_202947 [Aspergillus novoparasiticus]|uniref:Hemerythrin-like domain-containing protein n=1 Tax=Aspergillus novoparasiticus TaxID=986946 RepID=A0A5N6EWV8_9EURO|nr:hypothetical protein BDV33DRAFT_202947 [Aspergillus novoparasiticus]